MFRTEAAATPRGNFNFEARCENGHTCYKNQMDKNGPYKCPIDGARVL